MLVIADLLLLPFHRVWAPSRDTGSRGSEAIFPPQLNFLEMLSLECQRCVSETILNALKVTIQTNPHKPTLCQLHTQTHHF